MKPVITWIVVADGARASFYQNDGPGHGVRDTRFPEIVGMHEPTRAINADRPGRMQVAGAPRHAMDWPSDPHRELKRTFAKDIAEFLTLQERAKSFDRLVLVAPAKTLGDIRAALDKSVAQRVYGEVPKDLTSLSARELSRHLESVICP